MMNLIKYLVSEFATLEVNKYKGIVEDETEKLGDMLRFSIETGMENALNKAVPAMMSAGFTLIGFLFLALGVAGVIDTYVDYEGVGYIVVGVLGLLAAFMAKK